MKIKALPDQKIEHAQDLTIRPAFAFYNRSKNLQAHIQKMQEIIFSVLPDPLPFFDRESLAAWIEKDLPLISWSLVQSPPDCISIYFLIKPIKSLSTETFISEMIKQWLLPYQETTVLSFEHMSFHFDHCPKETVFIGKAKILIQSQGEFLLFKENLPLFKREIISILSSGLYAKALLKTKILPLDHKMNLIRESFIKLLARFPSELDEKMFESLAFMQVYTASEFRQERSYIHLGKLILTCLIFRNQAMKGFNSFPEKRHMNFRLMPTKLSLSLGKRAVLGLFVAVNLFDKYELFDENHVLRAVKEFLPNVQMVPGSSYTLNTPNDPIISVYIELEKTDGTLITLEERKQLKKELKEELKKRVERLMPSIFMVRNEEEIMRNILMLSQEIKSKNDIPQMMISFDQHSQDDLIFTVVILRVKYDGDPSLQDLLKNRDSYIRYLPDRIQNVSYIDHSIPVEANVFRLQMVKLPSFLRMDFSVNLYLAREEVARFLHQHMGEMRDYNGGMIIKQGERLTQFRRLFHDISKRDQELLENFFYSLNPIEMQAMMSLQSLSLFFELFMQLFERELPYEVSYISELKKDDNISIIVIKSRNPELRLLLEEALFEAFSQEHTLVSSSLNIEGNYYLSCLYETVSIEKQESFKEIVSKTLDKGMIFSSKKL